MSSSKIITLKDGTRINGQIMNLESGRYAIQSPSMGEVKIKEDDIISITSADAAAAPTAPAPAMPQTVQPVKFKGEYAQQMQAVQSEILSNPNAMAQIQELMSDPQIMEALKDPAFVAAIQSGDPNAVQSSPQFQKLLNDPKMQNMIQKIQPSSK
ncbi:MAG: hypothetical protein HQL16_06650 [Candidatus Omnitrophica bacterium]|nr:hypothetical protein [Candidatus Omnitrophota bacterium]